MSPELDIQNLDFIENDLISRMATSTSFEEWWALRQQRNTLIAERDMLRDQMVKSRVEKAKKLSDDEISAARGLIAYYNKHRYTATQTIKALQKRFSKLADQPDAARVYWTETKRDDTRATKDLGEELGFDKFKVVLSPSACQICRKKTDDGEKIFKTAEISKSGYGHAPPFHPNCYCILIPQA